MIKYVGMYIHRYTAVPADYKATNNIQTCNKTNKKCVTVLFCFLTTEAWAGFRDI